MTRMEIRRSADFQSALSPNSIRRGVETTGALDFSAASGLEIWDTAEGNSALLQNRVKMNSRKTTSKNSRCQFTFAAAHPT